MDLLQCVRHFVQGLKDGKKEVPRWQIHDTPAAFDRALKKAVREAGVDPGAGYRQGLRDRFLCRALDLLIGRKNPEILS